MRLSDSLNSLIGGRLIAKLLCVPALLAVMLGQNAGAQTALESAPVAGGTKPSTVLHAGVRWLSLTKNQKTALLPLEGSWDSLSDGQKSKWLALAKNYPELGPVEQEKLHSRMAEWAALPPKDRELARLNFAQSKTAAKSDRAADWEAYQALSPDERKKLAQGSKVKVVGAAVAVKPVAPEKLTPVPVTRHTPEKERATAVLQNPINRNTLLPQLPGGAATSAPLATPSKP